MMERDHNLEDQPLADFDLAEPHFNDERTIQTARPVVPLNPFWRVLTKQRLVFAGAFVLAALLGAGSALAIIQLRRPEEPNFSEAAKTEESGTQPVAETAPLEEPNQTLDETPSAASIVDNTTDSVPARRAPRRARRVQQSEQSTPRVTISIQSSDSQPQARLVDEWQERRQRRVGRPERPNNHHPRDLFRIREIFEGQRRRY